MGKRTKGTASHTADTTAVSGIKGFAGIPRCVVESSAYRHLQLIDRAILVEIVNRMKGDNNGKIHISYAELAAALNRKNQAPIGPSIGRLMQHGLLDISADSAWQERRAREYRLTFVNTSDSIGRPIKATNDYVKWGFGDKFDTTYAVAERPKSATTFVAGGIGVATDVVAGSNAKQPKTSIGSATNGVVPIYLPYTDRGWWTADRPRYPTAIVVAVLTAGMVSKTTNVIAQKNRTPCENCGEPFNAGSRGQPKRFCNETCRKRAERQRAANRSGSSDERITNAA